MQSSDVAFTIVVNRQADDDDAGQAEDEFEEGDKDNNRVEVDFVQEAVQDAIQEAVQDAIQEVCSAAVCALHDTLHVATCSWHAQIWTLPGLDLNP